MTRIRPADVRFYIDADLVGVAKVLVTLRPDVTYPGDPGGVLHKRVRPACPVTDIASPDEQWIPVVAKQGWLIITRDARIRSYPAELAAVRNHRAKMINLASNEAGTRWEQLRILLHHWPQLEELQTHPGPFIYRATRTRLAAVNVSTGLVVKASES